MPACVLSAGHDSADTRIQVFHTADFSLIKCTSYSGGCIYTDHNVITCRKRGAQRRNDEHAHTQKHTWTQTQCRVSCVTAHARGSGTHLKHLFLEYTAMSIAEATWPGRCLHMYSTTAPQCRLCRNTTSGKIKCRENLALVLCQGFV